MSVILYKKPQKWLRYENLSITRALVEAKSTVLALRAIPYQRAWVESLQQLELKREVAGTSRLEGAEFTERELESAMKESAADLLTRSQRQAHAAVKTYRWIAELPPDMPVDDKLIRAIHFRIVKDADDDHCVPGQLRKRDENVTFGSPRHRGVEGGSECEEIFAEFARALNQEFGHDDPLIQALASHYHLAAMHPFLDGNGRTARALEALLLQRAGLKDSCFIAMSNYYYDEKSDYLKALSEVRARDHDLTPFLVFGLKGIAIQSRRLLAEIQHENSKALFKNLMYELFTRMRTPKKRVIAERQLEILKVLLDADWIEITDLADRMVEHYRSLGNPAKAARRDISNLAGLGAIKVRQDQDGIELAVRLEWPTEITETEFFRRLKELPTARSHSFLS